MLSRLDETATRSLDSGGRSKPGTGTAGFAGTVQFVFDVSRVIQSRRRIDLADRRNTRRYSDGAAARALRYPRAMLYVAGGLLALIVVQQLWRWWRSRVDVEPVSDRWLAERRGARDRD